MLENAQTALKNAAKKIGVSQEDIQYLLTANKVHHFDLELSNGTSYQAFRAQHNNVLGPYKGGIRFHANVSEDEIRALALLMTLKTAAAGLPLGGGKGGVVVNPKDLDEAQLEELSRSYVQQLAPHIGPQVDVPAPDVNTNGKIIDWMVEEYEKITGDSSHASFTGKTIKNGGSEGRLEATGRGGALTLIQVLNKNDVSKNTRFAVQGFGNVGSYFAVSMQELLPGAILIAASDSRATLVCKTGLDPKELSEYKTAGKSFADFDTQGVEVLTADAILSQDVEVLTLAALENAVTTDKLEQLNAKYILELANGPVSDEAHDELTKNGVVIIPDIIANSGGVIVSYLEWLQNLDNEHWSEEVVRSKLKDYIERAADEMLQTSETQSCSLKDASMIIAIRRILEARNN